MTTLISQIHSSRMIASTLHSYFSFIEVRVKGIKLLTEYIDRSTSGKNDRINTTQAKATAGYTLNVCGFFFFFFFQKKIIDE